MSGPPRSSQLTDKAISSHGCPVRSVYIAVMVELLSL